MSSLDHEADLDAIRQALGVTAEFSVPALVCAILQMRQENRESEEKDGALEALRSALEPFAKLRVEERDAVDGEDTPHLVAVTHGRDAIAEAIRSKVFASAVPARFVYRARRTLQRTKQMGENLRKQVKGMEVSRDAAIRERDEAHAALERQAVLLRKEIAQLDRRIEELEAAHRDVIARHDKKCTCGGCCIARSALTGRRGDDLAAHAQPTTACVTCGREKATSFERPSTAKCYAWYACRDDDAQRDCMNFANKLGVYASPPSPGPRGERGECGGCGRIVSVVGHAEDCKSSDAVSDRVSRLVGRATTPKETNR
jgi:hypothetical protein